MHVVRLATAGNVDDGKSTLIGRLLVDSKAVLQDQLDALLEASARRGCDGIDLALLTDGLRAEREQGITIDVAYRYFSTAKRKFIIADCPGHVQYTRNMVSGASTADVAIVLVDITRGIQEQTRRHCLVASLLKVPHIIACVNKMDLAAYAEDAFLNIARELDRLAKRLDIPDLAAIPISALKGDNVVEPSARMPWYRGQCLLAHLEDLPVREEKNFRPLRLQFQSTVLPRCSDPVKDYRGYAGFVSTGSVRAGEEVILAPSGAKARVSCVELGGVSIEEASAPRSVTLRLDSQFDVARGDLAADPAAPPKVSNDFEAMLYWMGEAPFELGKSYRIKHGCADALAVGIELHHKLDIRRMAETSIDGPIAFNDFAKLRVKTSRPLAFDPYRENRSTGSFILIDEATCATVGAGMIL